MLITDVLQWQLKNVQWKSENNLNWRILSLSASRWILTRCLWSVERKGDRCLTRQWYQNEDKPLRYFKYIICPYLRSRAIYSLCKLIQIFKTTFAFFCKAACSKKMQMFLVFNRMLFFDGIFQCFLISAFPHLPESYFYLRFIFFPSVQQWLELRAFVWVPSAEPYSIISLFRTKLWKGVLTLK